MNKLNKRYVAAVLTAIFSITLATGYGTRTQAAPTDANDGQAVMVQKQSREFSPKDAQMWQKQKYGSAQDFDDNQPLKHDNPDEIVRVIVQMQEKPAVESSKSITNVKSNQSDVKEKASKLDGAEIRHTYGYLVNGFSMNVKKSEIEKIKAMPGVKTVTEARVYQPEMTTAKSLTQVYDTWKNLKLKGEGMVVSIIDTGIDWSHKDMKLTDSGSANEKLKKSDITSGPGKWFSDKVPYGYNFADVSQDVVDRTDSMHGMHVAGIVGANGTDKEVETNEAIQGVAPECQLLAMKVFANDPKIGGAFSDDIVAAIEDSVLHKADVINMSLGSNAGFMDAEDPEQKAVKNAVDKGVMVVVSAGNSQYSTGMPSAGYSTPIKFANIADTGVVGSPGIAKDSLQVASYENTNVTCPAVTYKYGTTEGTMSYFTSDVDPLGNLKGEYELVDCGLGQATDFQGKDLKGKIALIQRGVNTFVDKKINAQNAGAIGAILFNKDGDDSYISMVTDPSIKIPCVFINNTDGKALKAAIASGVKVSYEGKVKSAPNVNSSDMSDFTSWGPAPSLDFKPEIAAPGGNIYSTVNNNKYESMSGTSMAAPHTSGAEALILQAIKKNNPKLSGRDLVELAKSNSINTAKTEMDKAHPAVPYSPRRQGAGLIQILDSINNKVMVKDDNGSATVALKEVKGKVKSFNLNLTNFSDKDVTYSLSDIGGVLTEQEGTTTKMSFDQKIEGAAVTFDKENNKVTLPANGKAAVKVTITLPNELTTERFVEGFVKFTSETEGNPNLVVPYIGFYGDWGKQDIIDKPMWDVDNTMWGYTSLLTQNSDNKLYYLGFDGTNPNGSVKINKNNIAISPNMDGVYDNVTPALTFIRSAKEMKVQVLDKDGKLLSTVAYDKNVRKNVFNAKGDNGYRRSSDWTWDGKLFNQATGKYEAAPDGQYYVDYVTKVDLPNAAEQHLQMPVKVDLTKPEIHIISSKSTEDGKYKLQWTVTDNLSGDSGEAIINVNGEEPKDLKITKDANNVYSCDLNLNVGQMNNISISASDCAMNLATQNVLVKAGVIPFDLSFDNLTSRMTTNKNELNITGKVSYKPGVLKINGEEVKINDNLTFSKLIKFKEGRNVVTIYALDIDGKTVLKDYGLKVDCDTQAPVITLESPTLDNNNNNFYTNTDSIILKGKVSDNGSGYKFYVNGEQKLDVEVDGEQGEAVTTKDFDCTIKVTGNANVELKAVDLLNNTTIKNINVIVDKDKPIITIKGVVDGKTYNTNVKPDVTADKDKVTMTLNGKAYNGEEITADGNYELIATAVDAAGNSSQAKVNFAIDKTAPAVPTIKVDNTDLTNKDVMVTLSSSQDAKTIQYSFDNKTWTDYAKAFAVDSNRTVYARSIDVLGNISEVSKLEITNIDKTAPVAPSIKTNTTEKTNTDLTAIIQAEDGATILYSLDNEKWNPYSKALTISENVTVYAKAIDKAGNVSEISKLVISNIDKTPSNSKADVSIPKDAGKAADTIMDLVKNSKAGEKVVLNANDNPVLDAKVFEALKGVDKPVSVTVESQGMTLTWTFNGKDIKDTTKSLDLSLNAAAPNKDLITKVDGNAQILSFKNHGTLPAPMTITIPVDTKKFDVSKPLYFYYYNETTKKAELIADGLKAYQKGDAYFVDVTITHCSDYFLSANDSKTVLPKVEKLVQTGSPVDMNVLLGLGILLIGTGFVVVLSKRRRS